MKPTILLTLSLLLLGTNLLAADFYWVGGSGQWNDVSHWATSSGGGVLHFATPSANDDVYFDENSFTAADEFVDFMELTVQCRSLSVTTMVPGIEFRGEYNGQLDIHGNLTLSGTLTWLAQGQVNLLASNGPATIDTDSVEIGGRVLFAAPAGNGWEVLSDFFVNNSISAVSGSLTFTPGVMVTAGNLNINGATVDYTDVTLAVTRRAELTVRPAELPSLRRCHIAFSIANSSAQLALGGAPGLRFATIRSVNDLEIIVRNNVDVDAERVEADSLLVGGNGQYRIDVTTDYLGLEAGTSHNLRSNVAFRVGAMDAIGSCTETISLVGQENTTLGADAGAVLMLENLYVENIQAVGTADFTALRSSGTGDVSGWTFQDPDGPDRYWVGGSGNWSDPAHWSLTSGGAPGACLPSALNNVIFDAASFTATNDSIILPEDGVFRCNLMDWRGLNADVKVYQEADVKLEIFGSCYFNERLSWLPGSFQAPLLTFRGDATGREIETFGKTESANIYFNGASGDWTLLDDLTVAFSVQGSAGLLNTDSHTLTCGQLRFDRPLSALDLADSDIIIPAGVGTARIDLRHNGFISAGASIRAYNADGSLEIDLNGNLPGQNSFRSIYSSAYCDLDADDFYTRKLELDKSAVFRMDGAIDSLLLTPGGEYLLRSNGSNGLAIGYLRAEGDCFTPITLRATVPYAFTSTTAQRGSYLQLTNINATGPNWEAASSLDLDGNTGWTFTDQPTSRTLYWVGGGGHWFDPVHWSETSGGVGGACLPTRLDDVIIDAASFPTPGDTMELNFIPGVADRDDPAPVCRSFDASALATGNRMNGYSLEVYGSCYLAENIDWAVGNLNLFGSGTHDLVTEECNLPGLSFLGIGDYFLTDSLIAPFCDIDMYDGTFNTAGFKVHVEDIHLRNSRSGLTTTTWDIGTSQVTLSSNLFAVWMISEAEAVIRSAEGGKLILTGNDPYLWMNSSIDGLDVEFVNSVDNGGVDVITLSPGRPAGRFKTIHFRGDGNLQGPIVADSLLLTKGFAYRVEELPNPLTIREQLVAVGTACNPISIQALRLGGTAEINFVNGAGTAMDYVRLDRVDAVGPLTYLAGRNSVNVNNSASGWVYETNPTVASLNRFFLGNDLDLCTATVPRIVPDLPPNFDATYEWRDGTTTAEFQPPGPGVYRLNITFDEGQCSLADSVTITAPAFALDTQTDYNICGTDTLRIEVPDPAENGYSWAVAEGEILEESATSVLVRAPGRYFLRQELLACIDSIEITVVTGAAIRSAEDVMTCQSSEYTTPLATYTIRRDTVIEEQYAAASGCDSLHTLIFTTVPAVTGASTVDVCAGSTHVTPLGSYVINTDTSFTEQYQAVDGCDSLHALTFTLRPAVISASTVDICTGSTHVTPLGSYVINADTSFTEKYQAVDGCDSLHTLMFTLRPAVTSASTVHICAGSTHVTPLGSYVINVDTSFTEQYQAVDGCDSLHTLTFSLLPTVTEQSSVELCEMGTFSTSQGNYTMTGDTIITETYTAFNGCDSIQTWVISLLPPPTILEAVTVTDISCAGGSDGSLRVPGGNFLFYLEGTPVAADSLVEGLSADTYELSAETPRGCVVTRTFAVEAPAALTSTLPGMVLITDPVGFGVRAEISGGTAPYVYRWQVEDSTLLRLSCEDCPNPLLVANQPSTLDLLVVDAVGCTLSVATEVRVLIPQNSYIPQAFSPNDDGINDFLTIYGAADAFTVTRMKVYDRWGGLVHQAENFAPGGAEGGWDGAGRKNGVFAVVLELRWPDGRLEMVRGVVQLLR